MRDSPRPLPAPSFRERRVPARPAFAPDHAEARHADPRFGPTAKRTWPGLLCGCLLMPAALTAATPLPTAAEALQATRDVWGEAALAQPNGASYEFFAPLLPPPRYVNADFRHYPIVLSAPRAKVKARLISNGGGVNLRGGARSWNDPGAPVTFRVGPDEFLFGGLPERTLEPTLAEGWLPIVAIRYRHTSPVQSEGAVPLDQVRPVREGEVYQLEAFASTDPVLAEHGVVCVRFSLAQGRSGHVAVNVGDGAAAFARGDVTDAAGGVLARFDSRWRGERGRVVARIAAGEAATLAIATRPLPAGTAWALDYAAQRAHCVATWRAELAAGMRVETPEARVNDAWRHLLVQNVGLISGDRMHYSAGNQYDRLYEAEGSDAALALLAWGRADEMRRLIVPLLDFTRPGLENHQAGFKVMNVVRTYWQTRDAAFVRHLQPRWAKEVARLVDGRTGPHGLYPAERYTGDISTPAQAVNVSAHGWRALRDLGAVLADAGETAEAERLTRIAAEFRPRVLAAIAQNARRETSPPFVPVALFSAEPAHTPIVRSRIGSYWNIIIGYTVGSGIFPPGSPEETWIPRYQENHGGILLGMVRSGGDEFNFWTGEHRVNPLYGTRYALDTLRRDDPERALVSFYGMLAQGFTRNTFVSGEGAALTPYDERGRVFYCPPNSAANAHFLALLRNLLVQDWDLSDDGQPDTLRLLFATPRRWLEDGREIRVERAPTAFGEVSVALASRLAQGAVVADVTLPARNRPVQTLLRARVPEGWRVRSATAGADTLTVDGQGTVDLTRYEGRVTVRFAVERD